MLHLHTCISSVYICVSVHHGKQRYKNFLYSYLKEQPIWQSLRFWNAAFFDAVQNERARKPVCTRWVIEPSREKRDLSVMPFVFLQTRMCRYPRVTDKEGIQ